MNNYRVLEEIGRGSYGIVHKVQRLSDEKVLCWKEINYAHLSERERA